MNKKPISRIHAALILLCVFCFSHQLNAANCASNCLFVWSVNLTDLGTTIRASVKIVDEFNSSAAARNSTVHGLWTRPDGTTVLQYARIGTRLRADFNFGFGGIAGTYRFEVIDVVKSGYTFDPVGSDDPTDAITIQNSNNQLPIAVINTDQVSGEAPLDVSFDALSSHDPDGVISSYLWNFGDGITSNETNLVHTYSVSGSYTVTLTVLDDLGARVSSSLTIDVTEPQPSVTADCQSLCLALDEFKMSLKDGMAIGKIRVMDENGNTVYGVTLDALWTLPNRSTVSQIKQNGDGKLVRFHIPVSQSGTYTVSVTGVSKAGYQYAPVLNVEESGSFLIE